MAPRGAVRLVDVARRAEVSVSTASRALSRPEMVRPETRARVQNAVAALGYVPNRMAQWLITGESTAITVVIPEFTDPYFTEIGRAVQGAAEKRGYEVVMIETGGDATREREILASVPHWSAGLVVCTPVRAHRRTTRIVPIVYVDYQARNAHCVVLDQRHAVELQIKHLADLGHRRILWVAGVKGTWATEARRDHVHRLQASHDIQVVDGIAPTLEGGAELAESLDDDVTAIALFNDRQAIGFMGRAPQFGISVPDDVSVVSVDDVPVAPFANPPLTTVRAPRNEFGRTAISLLLDHVDDPDAVVVETLRGELAVRSSTGPPPERER